MARRWLTVALVALAASGCEPGELSKAGLVGEWRLVRIEGGWLPPIDIDSLVDVRVIVERRGEMVVRDAGITRRVGTVSLDTATYAFEGLVVTPMHLRADETAALTSALIDLDSVMGIQVSGNTLNLVSFAQDQSDYVFVRALP